MLNPDYAQLILMTVQGWITHGSACGTYYLQCQGLNQGEQAQNKYLNTYKSSLAPQTVS